MPKEAVDDLAIRFLLAKEARSAVPAGWTQRPSTGGVYVVYEHESGRVRVQDTKRQHAERYQIIYRPDPKSQEWLEIEGKSSMGAAFNLAERTVESLREAEKAAVKPKTASAPVTIRKRVIYFDGQPVGVIFGERYWNHIPGQGKVPAGGFGVRLMVDGVIYTVIPAKTFSYFEDAVAEVLDIFRSNRWQGLIRGARVESDWGFGAWPAGPKPTVGLTIGEGKTASKPNPFLVQRRDGKWGIEFGTNRGVFVWTRNKSFTHSFKLDREDDRDRSPLTYDSQAEAQQGMKEALYEIYRYRPGDEDFVRGHEPVKVGGFVQAGYTPVEAYKNLRAYWDTNGWSWRIYGVYDSDTNEDVGRILFSKNTLAWVVEAYPNAPSDDKRVRIERFTEADDRPGVKRSLMALDAYWSRQAKTAKTNQQVIESPHNFHPVELQPAQAKRTEDPFEGFIDFQGLKIDVENAKGSVRSGVAPDGTEWSSEMFAHYGEIRGTEGVDGDKLDVYVGDNHDSSVVVVIYQHDPGTGKYDEDKVMIGFDSIDEAIGAYKKQYDRPGYFRDGEYKAMPIGQFWRWVNDTRKKGKKVTGSVRAAAFVLSPESLPPLMAQVSGVEVSSKGLGSHSLVTLRFDTGHDIPVFVERQVKAAATRIAARYVRKAFGRL